MVHFLKQQEFRLVQVRGSYHFFERGTHHVSVPVHGKQPVKIGTLRTILRDISLSPSEFEDLWDSRDH